MIMDGFGAGGSGDDDDDADEDSADKMRPLSTECVAGPLLPIFECDKQ